MKKIYALLLAAGISSQLFAGGILTNTNQSAMFTRTQSRDATLGIDAVYFNPAGLTLLPNNGFFLSLNSQTLGQTKTIKGDYFQPSTFPNPGQSMLNDGNYEGKVSAPVFPGVYVAYKMDKFVFSAGFNPIGGGGGGTYDRGLPSFEYGISDLVPALQAQGQDCRGYSMNAYFEGTSAWFGYQANISYQLNDMISVALGARFVQAKDTYDGYLKDVQLNMGGTWTPASGVFSNLSAAAAAGAAQTATASTNLTNAINGGVLVGTDPLADPTAIATLTFFGVYQAGMTNEQAAAAFSGVSTSLTASATKAGATSALLQDQTASTEATAHGVTPIISVNIKANDQLNISLKYEHKTKLEFTYNTEQDFTVGFQPNGTPITMFPDGSKYRKDLPSQLVVGATYKPMEKLLVSTGYHLYMDKNADWAGNEDNVDKNSWEFALGLEYNLTEKLLASAGWLRTKSGVTEAYQSDLSYSLPSNTIGGGFEYKINEMIGVNLAGSYTMYAEGEKNFMHDFAKTGTMLPVKETYDKDVWIVAIGVNFNFGAGK
jgi:long-chain fatty acid transport protein